MQKKIKFVLLLAVALPVFALAQVSTPTQSSSSENLGQGGSASGGPTPEMIAEMEAIEKARRAEGAGSAPVAETLGTLPVSAKAKSAVLMSDYLLGVIIVWLMVISFVVFRKEKSGE